MRHLWNTYSATQAHNALFAILLGNMYCICILDWLGNQECLEETFSFVWSLQAVKTLWPNT